MSKTVDERVVSMQFDNKHFEKNVAITLGTLDKLKQSLKLDGVSKGLENVNAATKKFDISPLSNGVETVRAKFSALEVMAVTALANITNSAVNAGKRIASALTIDPIKSGFQEYETQINAVQTILANTQSKGTTLDQVNNALDELNHYADKTIYNFTEMTRNIGTFTAAGVDLDTSVSAIKGIANLAAVSGSNSQQASTAMYQLSQALAAGTVKLMDWNSVVNAGMGGQVFQDALKETARVHGIAIDDMIKSEGSFRETLQNGWLSSEILTETLSKFTGDLTEEQIKSMGYTAEQAKEIMKLGETANDAATKVKTFTQLKDTLGEALQSGWTQSWEILIGDFEEAKSLWTSASDYFSEAINKSAEARNNLLQGWADAGGREMAIDTLKNTFEGLLSIMKPIKEAFKDVFPPMTADKLTKITKSIHDLTENFKLSDAQSAKLKSTFKGLFSIVDIGITSIKAIVGGAAKLLGSFTGLGNGVLGLTGSFGDWLSELRDSIKETDVFGKAVDKVVGFLTNVISKVKEFGKSIKSSFKGKELNGFVDFLKSLAGFSKNIGSGIADAFSSIGSGIAKAFGEGNFFEALNNGLFAGILLYVGKFVKNLSGAFEDGAGVLENVKGILDDVRGCFQAYQDQLKAGTLLKIASAIGVLAASIFVISTIDGDDLYKSLGAITVLFGELMGSLAIFNKMGVKLKGVSKSITMMIGMSAAILILSGAMKRLAGLDWNGLAKGLTGILGLVTILVGAAKVMDTESKSITKFAGQMVIMSAAISALTIVAKQLSSMSWEELAKGGAGILGLVTILVATAKIMNTENKSITKFAGQMILMSAAIGVLALVGKQLASMSWTDLAKGGVGILGLTTMLVAAAKIMDSDSKSITKFAGQMILMSASLAILTPVLKSLGSMSWDEIKKGLLTVGVALGELAIGLHFMSGTLSGSAALLVASASLAILAPVLKSLGSMNTGEIVKSLVTLAGAFTIIGVAGYLLTPVIPAILGLAAAFTLFGVSMIGIGAGLTLIGIGLTSIAAAGAAAATSLVASITIIVTGILDLIPTIADKLGEAIVSFCKVIGECTPQIAEALLTLITSALESLSNHIPQMVDSFLTLWIGVINSLADHLPELITSAVNLIGKFFQGIVDALNGINTENIFKGIIAVGLLTGLMFALSAVVGAIPSAMIGVVGLGAVVAELALVLAAIGGLAQIPGLQWLIGEGGNLLQKVGTAIGQFVGGIVGGIAQGVTSSLPKIAEDLSSFMDKIQPFIENAKNIDSSMMDGVESLSKAILLITAADLLNGITSWLTGGNSMSDFAEQLVPFGKAMKEYSNEVEGIDSKAVKSSASAGKTLAELAANLPNSGGLAGFFAGENNMSDFAEQLVPFGKAMKEYADEVTGLDADAVTSSATAAKSLAELADNLPNSGGLAAFFTGDNNLIDFTVQLVPFGKAMKEYSNAIVGLDTESVTASATAAKSLAELANNLPNSGGLSGFFSGENDLVTFADQLVPFGESMKKYADSISGIDTDAITSSATAAKSLAELANNLPNSGGLVSFFSGDNTLSLFADQLVPFGNSMKKYAASISGIDMTAVEASATAAKALAELSDNLPKSKTLASLFTGDQNLVSFGAQLVPFGVAMKSYSDSVIGIDGEAVTASANGAKALTELVNSLGNSGGLISLFTGDQNLATLGAQLIPFGVAMKQYSESVTGMDIDSVTNSVTAADALSKMASSIQNGGILSLFTGEGNIGSFSAQLVPFGKGLKEYADSVIGLNTESIVNSAKAVDALTDVANNISSGGIFAIFTGEGNMTSFGAQLVPFGNSLKQYSDSVIGLNIESITNSVAGARQLVNLVNDISIVNSAGVVSFVEALNTLGTASVDEFANAFTNAGPKVSNAISTMMLSMIETVNSQQVILANAFTVTVTNSLSSITSRQAQFRSAGIALMTALITGITSQKAKVIASIRALVTAAIASIIQRRSMFVQAGVIVMTGFASGITSSKQASIDAVVIVMDSCVTAINDCYQSFYDAGVYLGEGLIAGIESMEQAAYDAGYALGQAAVQGEKDGQQSKSPSKLTKKAGRWLGEGLIIGMGQMTRSVYNAGGEMGKQAVDSISNALEYVNTLGDSGLDIQPTISPVVDMSGMSTKSLNLASNIDLSLIRPIDSLSQIVSRAQDEINASNLEVINAINSLRDDLNSLYSDNDQEIALYVDSKKLATSIAKPMNRQLNILAKRGAY